MYESTCGTAVGAAASQEEEELQGKACVKHKQHTKQKACFCVAKFLANGSTCLVHNYDWYVT